ncbi:acyltransferase family protein [Hyphomonas pacifica]|uniref:acyltransferase family protein n=1 Tax=Hyphomonas pacifica TaxID=1280941 RepID=UPI000DBFF0C7|nr:acyltransferase [Hyphomonas pacifica]RAN38290.1 hypothetical protein HY11_00325 [Hyphomonas pacifica]
MKLQSVQVLRGLAALIVVLYHIRSLESLGIEANGLTEHGIVSGIFSNGYAGVDLFFVISGFIMVYVTNDLKTGVKSSTDFLFARITRIYPVWWLFAGMMTVYMVWMHGLSGHGQGWQAISRSEPLIPYLLKSFALLPQGEHPILGVGWTLVHEVYFYFVFAILLLLPRRWLPALLLIWGGWVIAGSLMGLSGPLAVDLPALFFYPMTMEFILGAAVGLIVMSGLHWRAGAVTLLATLWLMAALCYQGLETAHTLQWGRVMWFGLPSAALIYGLAMLDLQQRLAWLVPAATGTLACTVIYQLYGLDDKSADAIRLSATILAISVGAITMMVTIWLGWLAGQSMPERMLALKGPLNKVLAACVRLGDWSFSLYLCHMLVLSLLRRIFDHLGRIDALAPVFRLGLPGPLDNIAFVVIGVSLSIVASALAYRFYEKPCLIIFGRLRKKMFGRDKRELAEPATA